MRGQPTREIRSRQYCMGCRLPARRQDRWDYILHDEGILFCGLYINFLNYRLLCSLNFYVLRCRHNGGEITGPGNAVLHFIILYFLFISCEIVFCLVVFVFF